MSSENGVRFEERDLDFLCGLFDCRIMRLSHAASLFFGGSVAAAQQRTLKLKRAGVIAERERLAPTDPSILRITRKGYKLLESRNRLSVFPRLSWEKLARRADVKPLTIQHELEIMNAIAVLVPAIRSRPHLEVARMTSWPLRNQFYSDRSFTPLRGRPVNGRVLTKPDAFLKVHEIKPDGRHSDHSFFIEVDRGGETLDRIMGKASGYSAFYQSGGFAERCGGRREDFKKYGFRVLVIVPSEARRNNAAERLYKNHHLRQLWLTTRSELLADPLGAIWVAPLDVWEALRATDHDLDKLSRDKVGRNRPGRDERVAERLKKLPLFN